MGIMDQAAGIANGEGAKATGDEAVRARPILSIARPSVRTEASASSVEPENVPPHAVSEVDPAEGGHARTIPVELKDAEASSPVSEAASVKDVESGPAEAPVVESSAPRVEDAEHEGVEIARKAKEAAENAAQSGSAQSESQDAGSDRTDAIDPVTALVALGTERSDAKDDAGSPEGAGDPSSSEKAASSEDPNNNSMDYHEALARVANHRLRNGHIDIDDRITEYVRTNRREALDRPAPLTVKRELRAIKNGTVDEKLIQARKILEGGIESKDIDIQVAIQQMQARSARDGERMKSVSKGPAAKEGIDPSVMSAAATKARGAPGL